MNSYLHGTHAAVYVGRGSRLNANRPRSSSEDLVGDLRQATSMIHAKPRSGNWPKFSSIIYRCVEITRKLVLWFHPIFVWKLFSGNNMSTKRSCFWVWGTFNSWFMDIEYVVYYLDSMYEIFAIVFSFR